MTKVVRPCAAALLLLGVGGVGGCASREMYLDLRASVMYEKPQISEIAYTLSDSRRQGGAVVVNVALRGDPGLEATFDISPGIVDHASMSERAAGHYVGSFSFPPEVVGGPYAVIGRLSHVKAGEVVLRDPNPLTISLSR